MEKFELNIMYIPILTDTIEQNKQEVERIKNENPDKRITATTKVISIVTVIEERTI